jgi:hypothetical protein
MGRYSIAFFSLIPLLPSLRAQQVVYNPPLTVLVVNQSAVVSDQDAARWTAAVARQVHEHLAPIWKIDANVVFGQPATSDAWVCTLEDHANPESNLVLGIHMVGADGMPTCSVNAGLIVASQVGNVSQTLSHEILEMLIDPWLSNVTFAGGGNPNSATVFLREICDPVAGYPYDLDGVAVADFTYPEFWIGGFPGAGTRLDRLGIATLPLQPTAHSYMLVRYITTFGGINSLLAWNYVWGSYCLFGPC